MIYCDTSLLVAALVSEVNSVAARNWLDAHAAEALVVSDWVLTEFASAIAMKFRRGTIDQARREAIDLRWQALLADTLRSVPIRSEHFQMARTLVDTGRNGLRAGDALHLAIVLDHGFLLVTFDHDLADAARARGAMIEIDPT